MKKESEKSLEYYAMLLTREFGHWDHLYANGGHDPFHADGMNLNLTRNHILSYKRRIEELAHEDENPTLFPFQFPDIYYRKTPDEVSYDYMAKPEEIRARALSQFALYEQDPHFQYILAHYKEAFPSGDSRSTKEAGLSFGKFGGLSRYQKCIEEDDLISMRRNFYEPYELKAIRWAEAADELRRYLSKDLTAIPTTCLNKSVGSQDSFVPSEQKEAKSFGTPEPDDCVADTNNRTSLDQVIQDAYHRSQRPSSHQHSEKQLSLFERE